MSGLCECGCRKKAPLAKKTDARKGWVKGEPVRFLPGHHGRMVMSGKNGHGVAVQSWTQEITEDDLLRLREGDDDEAARVLTERARAIERTTKRSFVELGMICLEVEQRLLWAKVTHPETGVLCHSWEDWAMCTLGVSRSSAFAAKGVLQKLSSIPVGKLMEITRVNLMRLASLSTAAQHDPRILKSARDDSEEDFIALVQKLYPDQHVEPRRKLLAEPTDSAANLIEECFRAVKWCYDATNREDVLEYLTAYFMDGSCEREGYTEMSNREAYEAALAKGVAA